MKNFFKRGWTKISLAALCGVSVIAGLVACTRSTKGTLIMAISDLNGKFSYWFSSTAYDREIATMTAVSMSETDREQDLILKAKSGEKRKYLKTGKEYTYNHGIADITYAPDASRGGKLTYTIELRDDVQFTGDYGKLTADDVLFTYHMICDPTYTGGLTLSTQKITGMEDYVKELLTDEQKASLKSRLTALKTKMEVAVQKYSALFSGLTKDEATLTSTKSNDSYIKAPASSTTRPEGVAAFIAKPTLYEYPYYVTEGAIKKTSDDSAAALTEEESGLISAIIERAAPSAAMNWVYSYLNDMVEEIGEALHYTDAQINELLAKDAIDRLRFVVEYGYDEDPAGKTETQLLEVIAADEIFNLRARSSGSITVQTVTDADTFGLRQESAGTVSVQLDRRNASGQFIEMKVVSGVNTPSVIDPQPSASNDVPTSKVTVRTGYDSFWYQYVGGVLDTYRAEYTREISGTNMVKKISGLKKINDYKLEVQTEEIEYMGTTALQLGVAIAPLSYYGDRSKFDGSNSFGFDKYNLKGIESKNGKPVGAGMYIFKEYKNNVVYFEANENYYLGKPKIKNLEIRVTPDGERIAAVKAGTIDQAEIAYSKDAVKEIEEANGITAENKKNKKPEVIHTETQPFNGYGYIGMNTQRVKVASDDTGNNAQSIALRKGFATILAWYRKEIVQTYYGDDVAHVIEYPIGELSWAAPAVGDPGYAPAFGIGGNNNGVNIQNETQAKTKATEYFTAAVGSTANVPQYTFVLPSAGPEDHPVEGLVAKAVTALKSIGVTLNVRRDRSGLFNSLDAGTVDMWCAAWSQAQDPDMYQIYHSENAKDSSSNHYRVKDSTLDDLIIAARTGNKAERKVKYKAAYDRVMELAFEIPVYQRLTAEIFNMKKVNVNSFPKDMSPFWTWSAELQDVSVKA